MTRFLNVIAATAARAGLVVVLALSSAGASHAQADLADELIPRSVFFGNPDRANVQISPDGEHLSYLAPHNGVMNIWVQPRTGGEPRVITSSQSRPIRMYYWAANSQQLIYTLDRGGDENFHLYAVAIGDGTEIDLTPYENIQARLIAIDPDIPDEILVAVNNRVPQLHDAWRINTRTGQGMMVFQNDAGYADLVADAQFNIRAAMRLTATGGMEAYARDSADGEWYQLASWAMEDSQTSGVLAFSRDGSTAYLMDSRGVDTGRLYAYSAGGVDGPTYTMLASNDRADLGDVIFAPDTGKPQAAAFEYERLDWRILDASIRDDWDFLRGLNDGDLALQSRTRDDRYWVVSYLRDDGPVRFYLYDRQSRSADLLFTNRSQLEGLALSSMKPVVIRSRDGLNLVSYLTVPHTAGTRPRLPMVLLVHGGPWARDSWGYNGLHQWLSNRGYAVLSVNFRGSTGFGKNFVNAGNREWSGAMHNDLIDAVNWAVDEGVADPSRVAIMGGSYGGYAALVGVTFTPDFFAAAVDIVGPSHVRTLLESIPPYWEPIKAMFEMRVGALSEPEYLDSISPLMKVDQIKKPLLIGQGANDPRVKEAESRQIVEAMQARSIPVTYVLFPDEGHGFARPENNLAFFSLTETFLAQHLGGRHEPITSEIRSSTAQILAGEELVTGVASTPPSQATDEPIETVDLIEPEK